MAVSSFQSTMSCSMTNISGRSRVNHFSNIPSVYVPSLRRNVSLKVRSMAEGEQKDHSKVPVDPIAPSSTPTSSPQPTYTRPPKMSTKFSDLMAFGGPAPERINGRLAMIGFVAALGVEIARGQGLFEQISGGGVPWFLGTSVLLTLASLIPFLQGVSVESKSKSIMSSDAELWNGRIAMLGLIALAFTEYVKGTSLV
ncbi:early light-induced protein, chloroplastic-like isoform X1 [Vicia villosa]|uniref:early light-induced protein, chloroplastic-like isoform X1 n=1 Tax=Vicia villosa TaxID=3911 RepID=UPI00273C90C9|nr:early light-induced protein, chloroplastic-like isoform X1 [Vicia villosa]